MSIRSMLAEESEPVHPAYRYGMLIVILILLANDIHWRSTLPPTWDSDRYGNTVVALMLLFNHLAFAFRWPTRIRAALWILAWVWLAFGLFYIVYLSKVLYPMQ